MPVLHALRSRAIETLLSSDFFIGGFSDGLRRSFPTQMERALSQGDVDSFSAPNEKVLQASVPESF